MYMIHTYTYNTCFTASPTSWFLSEFEHRCDMTIQPSAHAYALPVCHYIIPSTMDQILLEHCEPK